MKKLKFASHLVPLILSGEKTSTWRLFDDKDLAKGDKLAFIDRETGKEFRRAKVVSVRKKQLGEITPEDYDGHEKFESREEMFAVYRGYYGEAVNEKTVVKLINFILI